MDLFGYFFFENISNNNLKYINLNKSEIHNIISKELIYVIVEIEEENEESVVKSREIRDNMTIIQNLYKRSLEKDRI